jgi:hypothetical protein
VQFLGNVGADHRRLAATREDFGFTMLCH